MLHLKRSPSPLRCFSSYFFPFSSSTWLSLQHRHHPTAIEPEQHCLCCGCELLSECNIQIELRGVWIAFHSTPFPVQRMVFWVSPVAQNWDSRRFTWYVAWKITIKTKKKLHWALNPKLFSCKYCREKTHTIWQTAAWHCYFLRQISLLQRLSSPHVVVTLTNIYIYKKICWSVWRLEWWQNCTCSALDDKRRKI